MNNKSPPETNLSTARGKETRFF